MDNSATGARQLRSQRLERCLATRQQQQIPTGFGEGLGSSVADAAGRPGDQNRGQGVSTNWKTLDSQVALRGAGGENASHGPEFAIALILELPVAEGLQVIEMALDRFA